MTFAAYGIFGGIKIKAPGGKNPPDTPGSVRRRGKGSWLEFHGESPLSMRAEIDCPVNFMGQSRTDCPRPEGITLNEDGSCGPLRPNKNECQTFCEEKRTGLLGGETRAPGEVGESQPPGQALALTKGKETSISQGFSACLEGVVKEVFGAGVTYELSKGSAKMESIERTADPAADKEMWSRWVFFSKLIESCGTISKKKAELQIIGKGGSAPVCKGDVETLKDKCSISPYLIDGEASALWALRYEWPDGVIKPMEEQHPSYKAICNNPDPDGDGEDECIGGVPPGPA